MPTLTAFFKLIFFALVTLIVVVTQLCVLFFTKGPAAYVITRMWHQAMCIIFGIKITREGHPATDRQTLYMSNHISYLDIPVLGSMIKSSFVAKSEVEGWALFGFLSTLQQTAFIQRKKTAAARGKNALQSRIENGESLIIFPEGTSTYGLEVEPFKSSLFSLALLKTAPDLYVQPVTINLVQADGIVPKTLEERNIYTWPREDDTELHHHLWRFAKSSGAHVHVLFHSPIRGQDIGDRKMLAKKCYEMVVSGLKDASSA